MSQQANSASVSFPSDHVLVSRPAVDRNGAPNASPPRAQVVDVSNESNKINDPLERNIRSSPNHSGQGNSTMSALQKIVTNANNEEESNGHGGSSETDPLLPNNQREIESKEAAAAWWDELRIITSFAAPVFISQFLEYSLYSVSVVSIGHISATALAASALANMTAGVTGYSIVIGMGTALDTMLPSAWTSGTPSLVGLWSQRMIVLMTILLVPIISVWFNAERILLLLRQDPEVASLAGLYLKWITLGLPAYAYNCVMRRYFQSQGLFSAPTQIILIIAPTNIFLNWLLVWGPDWIRLGFIGAPIATSISLNLMMVLYISYGIFIAPKTAWHPITHKAFKQLPFLTKLGLAGLGQVAAEWWSWEGVALIASQISPTALAVQSVLLVSASTSYQVPLALSIAICVRIGNLLGAGNAKRAALAVRVGLTLAMAMAFVLSSIFLIFRKSWGRIFNDDAEVISQVARILPLVALFQVFDGLGGITGGIMRAKGQQEIGAMLNLTGYYVIGIPFGVLLAFKFHMGVYGLWTGLTIALMFVGSIGFYICIFRSDWEHEVEKARARLERDRGPQEVNDVPTVVV